jgi:hypothetical protein
MCPAKMIEEFAEHFGSFADFYQVFFPDPYTMLKTMDKCYI